MNMPFVKVMIHSVWGTKNREPFLTKEIRPRIIEHIRQNAKSKQIYIDRINGYTEHLHCLFGLNADMSIAKTMQLIKGESAYWINKQKLTKTKFEWADEYYAVSLSESILDRVRDYIDGQEEHHKKKTFQQEYDEFLLNYNFFEVGI
jgi:putative transposase